MLEKKVIDVTKYSLDDWLRLVFAKPDKNVIYIDYMFPTDKLREKYLKTIQSRSDDEVKTLVRNFLIPAGSLGKDEFSLEYLSHCLKNDKETAKKLLGFEYYRRLLKSMSGKTQPWEGLTWILDLLPHDPRHAINAIRAYTIAQIQFLPDGRITGLGDAVAIIRAKFIESPHSVDFLETIDPYEFEHLVESLYTEMGYSTMMTRRTHDGGKDIIAEKDQPGQKERILIQCKKTRKNISVDKIRSLEGVVSHERATKGVLVTTAGFTPDSKKTAEQTGRLELIALADFQRLMNEHFGAKWQAHLDYLISESIKRQKE
ncbi:restriction endonuclease [Methanoregula sp.]|jgi:restriction system protein|uniref:restriction endonuclease n=1 Tax=Methanoregula sp. TaxID=2052170 RepID=UPI00356677C2